MDDEMRAQLGEALLEAIRQGREGERFWSAVLDQGLSDEPGESEPRDEDEAP